MSSVQVNAEDLKAAATKLREAISYADKASEYSTEADPDWWMWGLCGAPSAAIYFPLADAWREKLSEVGQAIEGLSKRLEDSSAGWEDMDSFISEEFAKVLTDVEGAAGDFVRGTQNDPSVPIT